MCLEEVEHYNEMRMSPGTINNIDRQSLESISKRSHSNLPWSICCWNKKMVDEYVPCVLGQVDMV